MGLRQIRVLGDPVLRTRTHKVTRFDKALATLVEDMVETMRDATGVGLAAPQVGVTERVIIVETPQEEDDSGSGQMYVVVNPEIARSSQELVDGLEGCLSIPGYVGEVARHESVTVKGQDFEGRKIRIKAQGFLARAFQHEIDHLSGILFIDKLLSPEHIWRVDEGQEERAEVQGTTAELVPAELPLEQIKT